MVGVGDITISVFGGGGVGVGGITISIEERLGQQVKTSSCVTGSGRYHYTQKLDNIDYHGHQLSMK